MSATPPTTDRFIREDECKQRTGLSRWTRRKLSQQGHFPKPRKITTNVNGWLESEIVAWMTSREAA